MGNSQIHDKLLGIRERKRMGEPYQEQIEEGLNQQKEEYQQLMKKRMK